MANKREPISRKLRFEVFKRDKFVCQYCGCKAPDVVLHVDHIQPVASGGKTEIMNLITSCQPCNSGKGARLLTDDTVVERQRAQIAELEDRRQQLEMMLEWRDTMSDLTSEKVKAVCDQIAEKSQYVPNENGKNTIRKWLAKYSLDEVLQAVDESFDYYLTFNGDKVDDRSWEKAFDKVKNILGINKQAEEKPYIKDLFYIQGIARKRTGCRWFDCVALLETAYLAGASMESLTKFTKGIDTTYELEDELTRFIKSQQKKQKA